MFGEHLFPLLYVDRLKVFPVYKFVADNSAIRNLVFTLIRGVFASAKGGQVQLHGRGEESSHGDYWIY
jgi:hypothetical protein